MPPATGGRSTRRLAAIGPDAPVVEFVDSWHDQPRFIEALAATVVEAIARFEDPDRVRVMFTAHSLPTRVLADGYPYPDELAATAALVTARLGLERYEFAFQSAGRTGEPWLGPDILDEIRRLAATGVTDANASALVSGSISVLPVVVTISSSSVLGLVSARV